MMRHPWYANTSLACAFLLFACGGVKQKAGNTKEEKKDVTKKTDVELLSGKWTFTVQNLGEAKCPADREGIKGLAAEVERFLNSEQAKDFIEVPDSIECNCEVKADQVTCSSIAKKGSSWVGKIVKETGSEEATIGLTLKDSILLSTLLETLDNKEDMFNKANLLFQTAVGKEMAPAASGRKDLVSNVTFAPSVAGKLPISSNKIVGATWAYTITLHQMNPAKDLCMCIMEANIDANRESS